MTILCLGLNHRTAPVDLREQLNYSPTALQAALARFGGGAAPAGINELVVLSTCNRLELYAAVSDSRSPNEATPFGPLLDFLETTRSVALAECEAHLYRHTDGQAVMHLGRVAAGLDSMVLGEPQILGQVADALQAAITHGAAGPVLAALFRSAMSAGKRARAETAISRNPSTIGSVAVHLAETAVGQLAERRVVVIGAGEMAERAVEAFRARGTCLITVINRTQARAAQLADRWGARALAIEQLAEAVVEADLVLSSTDAPHFIISAELARRAMATRPDRPLVFIDIAVPRDVDPEVCRLPNVHCYNIDDLQGHLNGGQLAREQAIPQVEAIVAEAAQAFDDYVRRIAVDPLLVRLRKQAEAVRRAELDRTLRRLADLSEPERRQIDLLTQALVNKLLHHPTQRLKAAAANGYAAHYASAVRDLFALDE